jgi:HAD superfamily hydrolase (TIGR01509 family)
LSGGARRRVAGVILDVDGTLLDSNDAHAAAYAEALAGERLHVAQEKLRGLIGMGGDKLLARVGVDPRSDTAARVTQQKRAIFATRYLPRLGATPGARDLLDHMRARGLRLVVATSASREEVGALLHAARIDDLVEDESTSSDAKSSKPDPDIVEAAIARSGLDRSELAMLGDTPYDLAAAEQARVPLVALTCGGWRKEELARADAIYIDPADLLSQYEESLFGDRRRSSGTTGTSGRT